MGAQNFNFFPMIFAQNCVV